ncbi:helix-turn-helix domain-containing protein [Zongyangia hominis]|nr:helix-turn-helix transcriptional regulator [Zongyangia hominis]
MILAIGSTIARLRKERGLTQEQLASAVGVSAAAVSKWESAGAYPDITLISPIARFLGTTADALLGFVPDLTAEEVMERSRRCAQVFEEESAEAGLALCRSYLREYPNSHFLKFRLAGLLPVYLPQCKEEAQRQEMFALAKELLSDARESDDAKVSQSATLLLASLLTAEEPERAEALLGELPRQEANPDMMLIGIYLSKGDLTAAKKACGQLLYARLSDANLCLMSLYTIAKREEDWDRALVLLQKQRELLTCVGLTETSLPNHLLTLAECHALRGEEEKSLAALEELAAFLPQWGDLLAALEENPLFDGCEFTSAVFSPDYVKKNLASVLRLNPAFSTLSHHPRFLAVQQALDAL